MIMIFIVCWMIAGMVVVMNFSDEFLSGLGMGIEIGLKEVDEELEKMFWHIPYDVKEEIKEKFLKFCKAIWFFGVIIVAVICWPRFFLEL